MSEERDRSRGRERDRYPLRPAAMAVACRKLAADLRREAAAGWADIPLTGSRSGLTITRAEAAASLDARAERWEKEAAK